MRRASGDLTAGVGGSMIRVEEEGEDLDDDTALDEEEEGDESDVDDGQDEPASEDRDADGQSDRHRHRRQQQPQQREVALPSTLLAPLDRSASGRRLGRRASSAAILYDMAVASSVPAVKAPPAAGDKGLRLHFPKERSATIMGLAGGSGGRKVAGCRGGTDLAAEGPLVPQSKASAFLMSVLVKPRVLSSGQHGHSSGSAATNAIHYKQLGDEHGQCLRSPSSRRPGRTLLVHDRRQDDCVDSGGEDDRAQSHRQQAETPAEMVAELRRHRQQLQEQLAVLTHVHHCLDELGADDEEEHLQLCAAFVDAGLLVEIAAAMREFRFHAYFHICAANVLSALSTASSLYAFMMAELGIESILQKSATVHATHERLGMMASALLHVMEEAKTPANVQAARAFNAAAEKQRATFFADLVHTQLGLSGKDAPAEKRSAATASLLDSSTKGGTWPASRPMVPPLLGKRGVSASHSASRLRQMLTERLAPPPKLSAHYALVSAKAPPSMLPPPPCTPRTHRDEDDEARPRPATSPTKRSLSIDMKLLSSSHSAASAYGDRVVFVEPSPLHKRLPLRDGSRSASGVRRRLSVIRHSGKRLDSLTPRASSSGLTGESDLLDGVALRSAPSAVKKHQDADADTSQAERRTEDPDGEEEEDEYADESYEDDFSAVDDGNAECQQGHEGEKTGSDDTAKALTARVDLIDADNELMDMLADLAHHRPNLSDLSVTPSQTAEVAAATCIQRHVRGRSTRRRLALERRVEARARAKTVHAPGSTLKAGQQWQTASQSRARTQSPATKRSVRRPRAQSRSPSPSPAPSFPSASSSLSFNPPTRTRSESVSAHRPLPQPTKRSASLKGGSRRSSAPTRPPPSVSDVNAARDGDSGVSHRTAAAEASPLTEAAADDVLGGPDPLRRLQDLYAEGLRLHRAGQVAEAIERYEAALALAPASGRAFASVHLNLGSARMALGDTAAALEAFREARRVQPASAKAAFNEALALLRLGRTREGSRVLREVVRLEPTHERAREALAHVEGGG